MLSAPLLLPLPAAKLLPRSQRRPWRALGYVARADAEGWLTRVTFSSAELQLALQTVALIRRRQRRESQHA